MKKFTPLLIAACLLCTACRSADIDDGAQSSADAATTEAAVTTTATEAATTSAATETTTQTEADPAETAEAPDSEPKLFLTGVYCSYINDEPVGFYIMDDGRASGTMLAFDSGDSIGFEYEIGINEITFSYETAAEPELYKVTGGDLGYTMLEHPNGTAMDLIYEEGFEVPSTEFYSNSELTEMALSHYRAQTGYTPTMAASISNSDGTVTIQLYDNLGDHNSTSAWYTIDRFTAKGTDDITGEAVSLAE